MICPECNNSLMCHSLPEALTVNYRGFSKQVATQVLLECQDGCTTSREPLNSIVDMDAELSKFKVEINRRFSGGELCF